MLKMKILISDKLPPHPPSIKIKFKSKLLPPLKSLKRGMGERGTIAI